MPIGAHHTTNSAHKLWNDAAYDSMSEHRKGPISVSELRFERLPLAHEMLQLVSRDLTHGEADQGFRDALRAGLAHVTQLAIAAEEQWGTLRRQLARQARQRATLECSKGVFGGLRPIGANLLVEKCLSYAYAA